jgi:hypothetical protein
MARFKKYRRRTPADVARRIKEAAFPDAVRQVEAGDLEALRPMLPADYADRIIDALQRQRRPDRIIKRLPPPEWDDEDLIATRARCEIKMLQGRFGKPLPRGTHKRVIDWAAQQLADDGELRNPDRINWQRIRKKVGH